MKRVFVSILFILYSVALIGQIDTEFWFAAPEVSKNDLQRFDEPIVLRITTLNAPASIFISMPAEPSFIPLQISAGADTSVSVDLSPWLELLENKPANTILNKGILINATAPVTAYYDIVSSYCNCNPELYSLKGTNALGTEFLLPGQTHFYNAPWYSPTPYNAFDIVATENNTTVTITPAKEIVGHQEGSPFQIVLNKGQTWSGVSTGQLVESHLHGTSIVADKPVAVTISDDLLFGITCGADLVGDQIVPVNMAGNEYIGVRGFLSNGGDRLFILGLSNNTNLYFDGSSTPIGINRGEVYNHLIQNNSTHLSSSSSVLVYQTSGYGCELGSAVLPQIQCTGSESVSIFRSYDFQFGLLLFTEVGNESGFLVNGDSTIVTANDFSEVPGTNGHWMAARVLISSTQVPVGTTCKVSNRNGVFHLGLISESSGGCSYGYFSNFNSLELGPDLKICAGDTAILDAGFGMEPYLWSTGSTARSISVNTPGEYWVQAGVGSCQLSDTIKINIQQLPALDFGPDTLAVCGAISGFISVPGGYSNYQWNIPGNSNILEVTSPGIYSCQITDSIGCKASDSVYVTFGPLPADLGEPINPPVDLNTGLVAYYPFDGNANDESGNGNHGTLEGPTPASDRFGNTDGALNFDGFNNPQIVHVPNSPSLQFAQMATFSYWFSLDTMFGMGGWGEPNDHGFHVVFSKDFDQCCMYSGISSDTLNNLQGQFMSDGWHNGIRISDTIISGDTAQWNHLVFVVYPNLCEMYVNGNLSDTTHGETSFQNSNNQDLYFGRLSSFWYPFNGKLDDIRFYNRALTPEEVQCLYTGDCQQLVLSATQGETTLCRGGTSSITLFNAQAGVSYQVKDGELDVGLPQTGNADTLLFNLPDIFADKAFTILATDTATGCSRVLDSVFRVNVVPVVAEIEASLSSTFAPAMASLNSVSQAADSWTWLVNGEVVSATEQTQLELTQPGEYEIVLQVVSSQPWQCTDADTTLLSLQEQVIVLFEFPSAFSPNGDGYNDVFVPYSEGVDAYSVTVKDAWGRTMAEFDRSSSGWNGNTTGGAEAPAGAYYYQANATDYNGISLDRSGVVYLIRDLIDLTPNPVADKLVVSMNGRLAGRKQLRILQVSGKEIYSTDFEGETLTLDTSWLDKAMYIMQINNDTNVVNVKFVKE